jgi:hypothetical protein
MPDWPIGTTATNDWETCDSFLRGLHAACRLVGQWQRGRHVRERTVESTSESLDEVIHGMINMINMQHWTNESRVLRSCLQSASQAEPSTHSELTHAWPLPASIARRISREVHFLCFLRCRLLQGALPIDLWRHIILLLLPCVQNFGFTVDSNLPWVTLSRLPSLPRELSPEGCDGSFFEEWAARTVCGVSDVRTLRVLVNAWGGLALS